MTASLTLNVGDFSEITQAIKAYMVTDPKFADIDYDGANITALINLLGYNTYIDLFYRSMSHNETFRSTAVLRSNVVARAAELNYIPRSFRSAHAKINVLVSSTAISRAAIVMPKGTMFTARIDDKYYTFTTAEHITLTQSSINTEGNQITFFSPTIDIYEGTYVTDTYSYVPGQPITMANPRIDTTSMSVNVLSDGGAVINTYSSVSSALGVNGNSEVYFLRTNALGEYQIEFGNGVIGKQPKVGSTIVVEYRIASGELPNGARNFKAAQSIDGESSIAVVTVAAANGGEVYEDIDSIRFAAGKTFATQERAVGDEDFVELLKRDFPGVVDAIAYGGDKLSPPQYGRVVVCAVINDVERIPEAVKRGYTDFLAKRAVLRTPIFIDPQFIYVKPDVTVNSTKGSSALFSTIKTAVIDGITAYAEGTVGKFNGGVRMSKLGTAIDQSHPDIAGNNAVIILYKNINAGELAKTPITYTYANPISKLYSDVVYYQAKPSRFIDIDGKVYLVNINNDADLVISTPVGIVSYLTGEIAMNQLQLDIGTVTTKIYAIPAQEDLTAAANTVLRLNNSDINVTVK